MIRCTLAGTSTGTRHLRPGSHILLRLLAAVVPPETPDPMGLVELISATTWYRRGTGTRSARRTLVGAGTKNASLSLSPDEAGTMETTAITEKVVTEAGVSSKKGAEKRRAEAKNPTGPLADLPPHHPVEEVEAEAEAGDPAPAQNPLAMARVMHGNVSMNTDLTTLAQSASAG